MRAERRLGWLGHALLLALLVAYSLFPIYMVAVESLKSVEEDVHGNPFIIAHPQLRWKRWRERHGGAGSCRRRSSVPRHRSAATGDDQRERGQQREKGAHANGVARTRRRRR